MNKSLNDIYDEMFLEGSLDAEDYINLVTEGSEKCECGDKCDKAIEILNEIKSGKKDSKMLDKLEDLIDDMKKCADDKDDDDEEEEEDKDVEESVLMLEAVGDVYATAIVSKMSEASSDLDYVEAVLESDMVTEADNAIMDSIKARLNDVSGFVSSAKNAVKKVKDEVLASKLAKMLNDLAKRLADIVKNVVKKFKSIKLGKVGDDTEALESVITLESSDPIVQDLMEGVKEADTNLRYASAVLESDMMMTESPAVVTKAAEAVKDRLKDVSSFLAAAKSKMASIKDSKVKAQIAKILSDLSKRLNDLIRKIGTTVQKVFPKKDAVGEEE